MQRQHIILKHHEFILHYANEIYIKKKREPQYVARVLGQRKKYLPKSQVRSKHF